MTILPCLTRLHLCWVYEVLFGQGCKPTGPAERAVLSIKEELQQHLQRLVEQAGVSSARELLPETLAVPPPLRSVRVNLLKWSVSEALSWLRKPPRPYHDLSRQDVQQDTMLEDVLLFPAGTDLHNHPLVKDSRLILQSRASCMPAHALSPRPGWAVLDACAAPGNKTTHLAAMVGLQGRVLAFDKDPKRLELLKRNALAAGATNIEANVADFLSLDLGDPKYAGVKALLLDPSCSGSGTKRRRLDHLLSAVDREEGEEALSQRLQGLAKFQEAALRHAFCLPSLERLAYSTCSIHREENEDVVAAVMPLAEELGFQLADPFPAWQRRGLPVLAGSRLLVRVDEELDGTDGFFIAVFERSGRVSRPGVEGGAEKTGCGIARLGEADRGAKTDCTIARLGEGDRGGKTDCGIGHWKARGEDGAAEEPLRRRDVVAGAERAMRTVALMVKKRGREDDGRKAKRIRQADRR
eukprot:jgi/Botrbrau1/23349/Bobra.0051s0008.1